MEKISYQQAIKKSMEDLANDERVIFLGYNTRFGSKAYGTLSGISESKIIETPVAENLMVGLAIGMALEGYKPVVFFERHDFLLNALDGIVNHLDKLEKLSDGEFKSSVLIRATVGSKKPLFPGVQHMQDYTKSLKEMVSFPIYEPKNSEEIFSVYKSLKSFIRPSIIIEKKELYNLI